MEIIKEPSMQAICQKCSCEFTFEKEDVWKHKWGRKGCSESCLAVYCPICKTIVKVWE